MSKKQKYEFKLYRGHPLCDERKYQFNEDIRMMQGHDWEVAGEATVVKTVPTEHIASEELMFIPFKRKIIPPKKKYRFLKVMRGFARGIFTISIISIIWLIVILIIYNMANGEEHAPQWMEYWFYTTVITLMISGVFAIIVYSKDIATFIYNQFKCV